MGPIAGLVSTGTIATRMPRLLGLYVGTAGLCELAALGTVAMDVRFVPFFLMPRVGWVDWLLKLEPPGTFAVWFPEVFSGCWLILIGVLLLRGKRPVKTYIVSEVCLSFPTLMMVVLLVVSGGGHVLQRIDGLAMLLGWLFFTLVPLVIAIRLLSGVATGNRVISEPDH